MFIPIIFFGFLSFTLKCHIWLLCFISATHDINFPFFLAFLLNSFHVFIGFGLHCSSRAARRPIVRICQETLCTMLLDQSRAGLDPAQQFRFLQPRSMALQEVLWCFLKLSLALLCTTRVSWSIAICTGLEGD